MNAVMQKFIDKVFVIKSLNPKYRQPGDGSDGTCDCIGLVIGALKRMGISWYSQTGAIHGTNYASRKAVTDFKKIANVSDLRVGDVVFKAYAKGEKGWTLNKYPRYLPGGSYYNGDLNDYYHVGVVTSVSPLGITHMSSTCKTDNKIGKWAYHGRLNLLIKHGAYDNDPSPTPAPTPEPTPTPSGTYATVYASSGSTVKMRKQPSTKCGTYDNVPIGAKVKVVEKGGEWSKISYGSRVGWYMMTKFLKF